MTLIVLCIIGALAVALCVSVAVVVHGIMQVQRDRAPVEPQPGARATAGP